MFQKIKENKYYQEIQELLQNPRYRALIKLVLWGFFFLFVFGVLQGGSSKNESVPVSTHYGQGLTGFKNMRNYEYQMHIKSSATTISGVRLDQKERFVWDGEKYLIDGTDFYKVTTYGKSSVNPKSLEWDLRQFQPDRLYQLIQQGEVDSTTTYRDQTKKIGYVISVSAFIQWYDGSQVADNHDIFITTTEKDGKILRLNLI